MKSSLNPLELKENREKLATNLRNKGFYVRLHAYDYLVMYGGKILCTIHILPSFNECYINVNKLSGNIQELSYLIIKEIRKISPQLKIYVNYVPKNIT